MWEKLIIACLSTFQFGKTLPVAFALMNFWAAYLWVNVGGAIGVFATAILADRVLPLWRRHVTPRIRRITGGRKRPSRRRVRRLAKIKRRYGAFGVFVLMPILLPIPLSTVLTIHLFPRIQGKLLYLILALMGWSLLLGYIYSELWERIAPLLF
jgi:hypothetical protein